MLCFWDEDATVFDVDEWWTHHPDWRIVSETGEHYCFAKFPEPRGAFFRNLYKNQFLHDGNINITADDDGMDIYQRTQLPPARRNCSHVFRYPQVTSGVGAMLGGQMQALYMAQKLQRPFQMSLRRTRAHWKYVGLSAAQLLVKGKNQTPHWSWCPTVGLDCFILPISNCPHVYDPDLIDNLQYAPGPRAPDYRGYVQYLLRFQHKVRWRLRRYMDEHDGHIHNHHRHNILANCTAFHIRRGDAGLPGPPYRRYPSLLEYIHAGHVRPDEPIVLLTDDVTTIQEAQQFYPDYTWIYMNRTRSNMTYDGWGSHIHNDDDDPGKEIIAMWSEVRAAAHCRKFVHAKSAFVMALMAEYYLSERELPEMFIVDTNVPKQEVMEYPGDQEHDRARAMIHEIFREATEEYEKRMARKNGNAANINKQ